MLCLYKDWHTETSSREKFVVYTRWISWHCTNKFSFFERRGFVAKFSTGWNWIFNSKYNFRFPSGYFFIGLRRTSKIAGFYWTDGSSLTNENWQNILEYSGDSSGHSCIAVFPTHDRIWQALACNGQSSTYFVCEKN